MAASTTTFADRMKRVNKGQTTSWTVPGGGLADLSDERSFMQKRSAKTGIKAVERSTQKKNGPLTLALVVLFGFASVFLGRWLDFAMTERVFAMAADAGFDPAGFIDRNLTAGALGFLLCLLVQQIRDIKGQVATAMFAAYAATLMMEGQFVQFAPQLFEMVYAPAEIDVIRDSTNYFG